MRVPAHDSENHGAPLRLARATLLDRRLDVLGQRPTRAELHHQVDILRLTAPEALQRP